MKGLCTDVAWNPAERIIASCAFSRKVYAYLHVFICAHCVFCVYVCMYVRVGMHVCICTYTYTLARSHTHIHTQHPILVHRYERERDAAAEDMGDDEIRDLLGGHFNGLQEAFKRHAYTTYHIRWAVELGTPEA